MGYQHDELMHHGVKGMKWGVRKERNYTRDRYKTTIGKGGITRTKIASKGDPVPDDMARKLRGHGVKTTIKIERKSDLNKSDLRKSYDSAKSNVKRASKEYNRAFNEADKRSMAAFSPSKKAREANLQRWQNAADKSKNLTDARSNFKQVKTERKQQIKDTYKDLNKQASTKDKLLYNNATRKKAAKYVVDNNMSVSEATKRANSDARRNTAVLLAAYGAVTVGSMYMRNR